MVMEAVWIVSRNDHSIYLTSNIVGYLDIINVVKSLFSEAPNGIC